MFTKYWREYPLALQCFLFVLMMFIFVMLATAILGVIAAVSGTPLVAIDSLTARSPAGQVQKAVWLQTIGHLFTFTIPVLVFVYLTTPNFRHYLGLRAPGRSLQWLLVAGIMLGLTPLLLWGQEAVMKMISLGPEARQQQAATEAGFSAVLSLKGPINVLFVFLAMAVVPAIGEELLFRGLLMRIAHRFTKKMWPSVVGVAILFMLLHTTQPYGMPFIFTAGLVLGLIYWATGSLWCAVWGHLFFNGLQVVIGVLSAKKADVATAGVQESLPLSLVLGGAVLFAACAFALYRSRTPLPAAWSDDYPERSAEEKNFDFEA